MRDCLPHHFPHRLDQVSTCKALLSIGGLLNLNDIRSFAMSVTFVETFALYFSLFETAIMLTSRNRTSPHKSQASTKPILAITLAGSLNDFTIRCMF
jgi:hypothetical protein